MLIIESKTSLKAINEVSFLYMRLGGKDALVSWKTRTKQWWWWRRGKGNNNSIQKDATSWRQQKGRKIKKDRTKGRNIGRKDSRKDIIQTGDGRKTMRTDRWTEEVSPMWIIELRGPIWKEEKSSLRMRKAETVWRKSLEKPEQREKKEQRGEDDKQKADK